LNAFDFVIFESLDGLDFIAFDEFFLIVDDLVSKGKLGMQIIDLDFLLLEKAFFIFFFFLNFVVFLFLRERKKLNKFLDLS